MAGVAIVTDSTHYLPKQLVERLGIHQVSLYVGFGDERVKELEVADIPAFYDRLRREPQLPTTSQPSIGDFLEVWEELLHDGYDVVSIHLSGGISGTCETARQAQAILAERRLEGRVEVIDSETGCGGMGLLLLAEADAVRSGASVGEVVERVRRARNELTMWFAIDTLEYLRKGGRIGKAAAWLGTTLKIKPILTLEREITPVERVRTATRAFERLVDHARELAAQGRDGWAVQHIQDPDGARRLSERCEEIFGRPPLFCSEIGPVIGTYTGPGLLGVGGIPKLLVGSVASGGAV
jgi:DegV family protein with EDD domain